MRRAEVARRTAEMEVQKAQYNLEQERLRAEEIVREEISRHRLRLLQKQKQSANAVSLRVRRMLFLLDTTLKQKVPRRS